MAKFSLVLEGDKSFEEYQRLASLAEELGFYSLQIYEHLGFRPSFSVLFPLASATNSILLGPVTIPVFLYPPLYLAAMMASLNELTQGRAILGISRGAFYERIGASIKEMAGEKTPFDAVKESISLIDQVTRGKRNLEEELPTLSWKWEGRKLRKLYVGTSGPKMAALAASMKEVSGIVTDNLWNPAYYSVMESWVHNARRATSPRSFSPFEIIPRPFCSISTSAREARKEARKALSYYLPHLMGKSQMVLFAGLSHSNIESIGREGSQEVFNKAVENFSATGTPQQIANQLEAMLKAGAKHVCFGHPLGKEPAAALKLLGERVLPGFKED